MTKGAMLSDAVIVMSSLNLIAGEMDALLWARGGGYVVLENLNLSMQTQINVLIINVDRLMTF
jgi:hypothetical protein